MKQKRLFSDDFIDKSIKWVLAYIALSILAFIAFQSCEIPVLYITENHNVLLSYPLQTIVTYITIINVAILILCIFIYLIYNFINKEGHRLYNILYLLFYMLIIIAVGWYSWNLMKKNKIAYEEKLRQEEIKANNIIEQKEKFMRMEMEEEEIKYKTAFIDELMNDTSIERHYLIDENKESIQRRDSFLRSKPIIICYTDSTYHTDLNCLFLQEDDSIGLSNMKEVLLNGYSECYECNNKDEIYRAYIDGELKYEWE